MDLYQKPVLNFAIFDFEHVPKKMTKNISESGYPIMGHNDPGHNDPGHNDPGHNDPGHNDMLPLPATNLAPY